jgi:iron complex outermembrane receptor protein
MKLKNLLIIPFILIACLLSAQTTLSGKVVDEKGDGMTGVNVVVKGTTIGATTDIDGKFTLQAPADAKTIVFKYIGYEEREASVKDVLARPNFSVRMTSAEVGLNQVVVSASKKREKLLDAPASISVLTAEKLQTKVVTSSVDYLRNTAGVDIIQTGLVSNNVVVRGFNNIFSGSVLNVIDNRLGAVPSLRVNAYQLVPTSNLDIDRIEVLRGPASALYGPNASSGVIHIMTKSPLDQEKKFETTVAFNTGFTVQGSQTNGLDAHTNSTSEKINFSVVNPEFRHSGKFFDGKFGYKITGSYFQGTDFTNYDPREPYDGDSLVFGSVKNGQTFQADSIRTTGKSPYTGKDTTFVNADIRRFHKDFNIQKWTADGGVYFRPTKDITFSINGGVAQSRNIELTGLGAGQAQGWLYWYMQARFKWKNLFFQYFVNNSDAKGTYLIPQLSSHQTSTYNSPYQVQRLIDHSQLHELQIQHSWSVLKNLNLVYGADAVITLPKTDGTINGRFDGHDQLYQFGAYLQGDYDPLKWLKLVAALRVDYNSILNNAALSPRVALAFKAKQGQNIRLTFNRAFDAPTTLNQFLDLANGRIPNGIYVRGIGNPYGYNYQYDASGNVQFRTAPYGGTSAWVSINDKSNNYQYLDSAVKLIANGLAAQSGTPPALVNAIVSALFSGISGPTGLIQTADHTIIDYAALAQQKTVITKKPTDFQNLAKINNSTTQTLELGYKGLFFSKLQVQVDLYWTHMENYVSPLLSASGAVIFDLFDNKSKANNQAILNQLKANAASLYGSLKALDNQPAYTNNNIIKSDSGSVYDEVVVLLTQLPLGTVTPKSDKVNADYILTYKNLGNLDVFGADLGLQYQVTKGILIGGSFSWVDKDQIRLSTGEIAPLNAPKLKASLTFDQTFSKIGLGYGASWRWSDSYQAASAVYVGQVSAANLGDLRVSYRPNFYKKLLFAVNANNIFNYHWQSFPGTPHMGTTFLIKAMVTF